MSTTVTSAIPRRAKVRVGLGWEIQVRIWVSSIAVAVLAAIGDLRPAIFNEVLR
jgi:hypothetical protein